MRSLPLWMRFILLSTMGGLLFLLVWGIVQLTKPRDRRRDEDLADVREFQECQRQCRAMNDRRLTA